jgi:voltage-gated sodium channel
MALEKTQIKILKIDDNLDEEGSLESSQQTKSSEDAAEKPSAGLLAAFSRRFTSELTRCFSSTRRRVSKHLTESTEDATWEPSGTGRSEVDYGVSSSPHALINHCPQGRAISTKERTRYAAKIANSFILGKDTGWLTKIVHHWMFEKVIGIIIFTNVVVMGIAADYAITNLQEIDMPGSVVIEIVFCILYTMELAAKVYVYRSRFWRGPDRGWNIFDSLLVFQNIFEQLALLTGASSGSNLTFLRSMRLFKMVKMLRVIRLMRSMFELRIILNSIMGSMKSMFWSIVLLVVVLYMFALIFVQASATHLSTNDVSQEEEANLLKHWGGVTKAMTTLLASTTGGLDWNLASDPLLKIASTFFAIFLLYVVFFNFAILNTITSVFVEAVITTSMKDHQVSIQNELEKKDEYIGKLRLLFEEMDEHEDGHISLDKFIAGMGHPKMWAFAPSLGIEISDAKHFFELLSEHGRKQVDLETFVTGCIRMKGQAQSIDLLDLKATQVQHAHKAEKTLQAINKRLEQVEASGALSVFSDGDLGGSSRPARDSSRSTRGSLHSARDSPRIHARQSVETFLI